MEIADVPATDSSGVTPDSMGVTPDPTPVIPDSARVQYNYLGSDPVCKSNGLFHKGKLSLTVNKEGSPYALAWGGIPSSFSRHKHKVYIP